MATSRWSRRRPAGQVLVVFAVALVALILFVGLAVDAGTVYVSYGHLKRAIDAAAVAAANDFKRGSTVTGMTEAAKEVLEIHNVDTGVTSLKVYICDSDGDGLRDASLQTDVPQLYARCPNTGALESPRKLVWVEARQNTPLFFLTLLGFHSIPLTTNAIAEAAPIDLGLVRDISESRAATTLDSLCQPFWNAGGNCPIINNYDPDGANQVVFDAGNPPTYIGAGTINGCNSNNSCQPLLDAKIAAKALIDTLYDGYDQVSVVTYDSQAVVHPIQNKLGADVDLSNDLAKAKLAVDNIDLHDDPPIKKLMPNWFNPGRFNPVNPEDRDGNGADADPGFPVCTAANPRTASHVCCVLDDDRWDTSYDPYGWGGVPCDDDILLDAYDWTGDGRYTPDNDPAPGAKGDHTLAAEWLATRDPDGAGPLNASLSPLSTCTGCGTRVASNVLKNSARPGSVWVIVFLSDGVVNLSDTPLTSSNIPVQYSNGFCSGSLGQPFWSRLCIDHDPNPRYCIDRDDADGVVDNQARTCPPNYAGTTVIWNSVNPNPLYSVLDYARDMTDEAALTRSTNLNEPAGNDIAIYTIGLGAAGEDLYLGGVNKGAVGEQLLRYMAIVGDDGDRTTWAGCDTAAKRESCGQYYYAPSSADLLPIFEDIATRIYTRITD